MAASGTAQDGSTITLSRVQISRIASIIRASEQSKISSTDSRITSKLRTPTVARKPSAMVLGVNSANLLPRLKPSHASLACSGSAPITCALDSALTQIPVPPSRPPPPMGAITISTGCSICSSSSNAAVPCPAIITSLS